MGIFNGTHSLFRSVQKRNLKMGIFLLRSIFGTYEFILYELNFLVVVLIRSIYNQAFQKSKWVLSPFPLEMKKSQSEILIRYTSNINFK